MIPGPGTTTSYAMSEILASVERLLIRSITLKANQGAGTQGILKKGTVLGKITSGGKYAMCDGLLSANIVSGDNHIHVVDSQGITAADTIVVNAAAGEISLTVTSVPSSNQINVTAQASTAISGNQFYIKDGRETAMCILADSVDTTLGDAITEAYFGGCFVLANLVGLHANCITSLNGRSADAWLIF
jgi:hypothetical protein